MSTLLDKLRRAPPIPPHVKDSITARLGITPVKVEKQITPPNRFGRPVVSASDDLARILALPTREIDLKSYPPTSYEWLKKPPGPCICAELGRACAKELYQIQAWALHEATECNGLLGGIGVGHGKELICQLLPLVMKGIRTAILLIPPDMRAAFAMDWTYYGQHWKQPNLVGGSNFIKGYPRLKVIAYSELSHESFTAALTQWAPDLIIANEAHAICALNSARTGRVLTYAANNPNCAFVPMSGTMTVKSLRDYGHLSALALGEGSPLPIEADALNEWAQAIDPEQPGGKLPALMGALSAMCRTGEDVRAAFKRRRRTTPGVLDTEESAIPNALNMHLRQPPPIPPAVREAIAAVRASGTRPDGEEFQEAWQVARCLRELACGFFYRWKYPRGEPAELIAEWFRIRQQWNREVRALLLHPRPYLDSPLLAIRAAIRHYDKRFKTSPEKPAWPSQWWPAWREIRKKVYHETEAVWIDDWLAQDAAAWGKEKPGILWYANAAFGQKIAQISGLPFYGGGERASAEILSENGKRSIVASMKAHHKGKNLQRFSRNLVTQAPPAASMWEQLLGRTHRRGQQADSVDCWLYLHTPELHASFDRAIELAQYVEETTPNAQKLCRATYLFPRR